MPFPDSLDELRSAGARRRAIDDGTLPADAPPAIPVDGGARSDATPGERADPWPVAGVAAATSDGASATAARAPADAAGATAAPAGPWFDARAFFLAWLAMIVAGLASLPFVLVAAAGFATAYALARRRRLTNAIAAVVGGVLGAFALALTLVVIGLAVGG